jgi:hypothetical protein
LLIVPGIKQPVRIGGRTHFRNVNQIETRDGVTYGQIRFDGRQVVVVETEPGVWGYVAEHGTEPATSPQFTTVTAMYRWTAQSYRVRVACGHHFAVRPIDVKSQQLFIGKRVTCEACQKLAEPDRNIIL